MVNGFIIRVLFHSFFHSSANYAGTPEL